jgi:hypothetical protein
MLIAGQKFNQVSRENDEFQEGARALEKSIATESSDFTMNIAAMLERAKAESKHLADAAQTPDSTTLARSHLACGCREGDHGRLPQQRTSGLSEPRRGTARGTAGDDRLGPIISIMEIAPIGRKHMGKRKLEETTQLS